MQSDLEKKERYNTILVYAIAYYVNCTEIIQNIVVR